MVAAYVIASNCFTFPCFFHVLGDPTLLEEISHPGLRLAFKTCMLDTSYIFLLRSTECHEISLASVAPMLHDGVLLAPGNLPPAEGLLASALQFFPS